MTATARTIPDLRHLLTIAADDDRTPEEWMAIAALDGLTAAELVPLLRFAEPGSRGRELLARHVRFLIGKTIAAGLEMLAALESAEGLSGPIGDESLSTAEAQQAVERLVAAAHAEEEPHHG